jgi:hypothetical protein
MLMQHLLVQLPPDRLDRVGQDAYVGSRSNRILVGTNASVTSGRKCTGQLSWAMKIVATCRSAASSAR